MKWVAACHVVGFHCESLTRHYSFFCWGGTWVPFFFAVSGFVLTDAELRRFDQRGGGRHGLLSFMRRRMISVYPMYAVSLLIGSAMYVTSGNHPSMGATTAGNAPDLPYHPTNHGAALSWASEAAAALLLQSWTSCWEGDECSTKNGICEILRTAYFLNVPAWYLSALVFMWPCWHYLSPAVCKISCLECKALLLASMAFALVRAACYHMDIGDDRAFYWYSPLMNFHSFFSGMCLSRLFHARGADGHTSGFGSILDRFAVTVSSIALLLVYSVPIGYDSSSYNYAYVGGLLPLQLLLLWGLACKKDPVARFLELLPTALDEISYPLYITQAWLALEIQSRMPPSVDPMLWFAAVVIPASSCACWLLRQYFDAPMQRCLAYLSE